MAFPPRAPWRSVGEESKTSLVRAAPVREPRFAPLPGAVAALDGIWRPFARTPPGAEPMPDPGHARRACDSGEGPAPPLGGPHRDRREGAGGSGVVRTVAAFAWNFQPTSVGARSPRLSGSDDPLPPAGAPELKTLRRRVRVKRQRDLERYGAVSTPVPKEPCWPLIRAITPFAFRTVANLT